jgi:hypothetical protein
LYKIIMTEAGKRAVGRPRKADADKIDAEQVRLPLPAGGKAAIAAALAPGESMSGFIRLAIERELERRRSGGS